MDEWQILGCEEDKYQFPRHIRFKKNLLHTRHPQIRDYVLLPNATNNISIANPQSSEQTCLVSFNLSGRIVTGTIKKPYEKNICCFSLTR